MGAWVAISILFIVLLPPAAATDIETASLAGVKVVKVMVEKMQLNIEQLGLSAEKVQTDVELRLRNEGIPLFRDLPKPDLSSIPDPTNREAGQRLLESIQAYNAIATTQGLLYINVATLRESAFVVYNIEVSLGQNALLERDKNRLIPDATTWSHAVLGVVAFDSNTTVKIRRAVLDLVDRFANEYLSVNPRDRGR